MALRVGRVRRRGVGVGTCRKVNVRAVKALRAMDDSRVRVPLAWVAPTEAAFGGFTSTDRGVVAAQDVYPCGGTS